MTRLRADERGVSELIGYVLAFSIVVASVGVVYAGGLGAVTEYQQDERETNAERAFVALAESLNDLQRGDAPARNGEIRLAEGTLSMRDGPTISVWADNDTDDPVYNQSVGALSYAVGETRVAYVTGGVVREDDGAGSIAATPPFACTDQQALVSIVNLTTADATTRAGQGSVLIEARRSSTSLEYVNSSVDSVTVSFDESSDAWQRHLAQSGWTVTSDGVECDTGRVVVRVTQVRIDFL